MPDARWKLMTLREVQITAVFPLSAHIGVKLPLLLSHTGTKFQQKGINKPNYL